VSLYIPGIEHNDADLIEAATGDYVSSGMSRVPTREVDETYSDDDGDDVEAYTSINVPETSDEGLMGAHDDTPPDVASQ
jgi:hypothetical protein